MCWHWWLLICCEREHEHFAVGSLWFYWSQWGMEQRLKMAFQEKYIEIPVYPIIIVARKKRVQE